MIWDNVRRFTVVLDSPLDSNSTPVYSIGDEVSGTVLLEVGGSPLRLQSLKLHVQGCAKVHWTESRSAGSSTAYTQNYSDQVEYYNKRDSLIQADNGEVTVLQPGRYDFPFSFQLPEENLVTSFEGKHGNVRYWVKAKLHRPWSTVKKSKREFTVIEPIDINTPSMLASQAGTTEKIARVWYRNLGQVSLTAKIERKGYTPGEVIPIFAEIDNCCSRTVHPKASIVQTQTFIARGTMKQKKSVVATLLGESVATRKRVSWHGRPLKIPPVSPSLLQCRIIRVEYALRVYVEIPGTSKLALELPLVIGTIPLHPFGSRTSSIGSQYSADIDWLRLTLPERPEPPPDYCDVVSEEEGGRATQCLQLSEELARALAHPFLAYMQEFRYCPPPVYSEIDPHPQREETARPRCMTS